MTLKTAAKLKHVRWFLRKHAPEERTVCVFSGNRHQILLGRDTRMLYRFTPYEKGKRVNQWEIGDF